MKFLKGLLPFILILISAIFIGLDLVKPGLFLMHDDQHVARLFLFDEALKSGQFPVRWVDSLGFGFGYPLFIFYPPLVYIIGEIFHLIGFGFIDSIKLVFFASILFSGISMYVFARELFGKLVGLTAAVAYLLVPYRAIDVYIRGALAESFAFVWLPLILWNFFMINKTQKSLYVILSSVFLALLMITHNLIFLPFMTILPFYLLFLLLTSGKKSATLINFLFSLILAACLSAFFWIPSLLEKKFTLVDNLLLKDLADYKIHFVYIKQLWNSPWGFGGSAEGLADGISFKIGKLHILFSLLSLVISTVYFWLLKRRNLKVNSKILFSLIFFSLFIFSSFMTTNYSSFIWEKLTFLAYLQFPWRYLMFTSLFSSILMGASIAFIKPQIVKIGASLTIIMLLLITNTKLFKPKYIRGDLNDELMTNKKTIEWDVSKSSFEYVPNGFPLKRGPMGTNVADLSENDLPTQKAYFLSGAGEISEIKTAPGEYSLKIKALTNSKLRLNSFNFPGWKAIGNGDQLPIEDQNKYKLITLSIPAGELLLVVKFEETPVRAAANYISLISLLGLIALSFKIWLIPSKN